MASTGRASELACGFLLLLWILLAVLPAPPSSSPQGQGDASAFADAQQRWRSLMKEVVSDGEAALRPTVASADLRAAGDTYWMRYPGQLQSLDQSLRHRFQLVALSNDPEHKRTLLSPLLSDQNPQVRYRAWLEQARVHLRQGYYPTAATDLEQALQQAVPDVWHADAYLMRAVVHLEMGSWDKASADLQRAIQLDAGFWDARQLRLRVLSEALASPGQNPATCLHRSQQLLEDLGALPALADSHDQFRLLADRFAALGERGHPAFSLLAGLAYQWVGDIPAAQRVLSRGLTNSHRLPADCAAELHRSARQVLAELTP